MAYGSDLALTLARLDPAGVRSLVLDATVPPNAVVFEAFWPNASAGFDHLFRACRNRCASRYPALEDTFTGLVRRLEQRPVVMTVRVTARSPATRVITDGGALANWLVSQSFNTPQYVDVLRWIAELAAGKPQSIARSRVLAVTPAGYVGYGLTFGVLCREWYPFGSAAAIPAEGRRVLPSYPPTVLAQAPQFTYVRDDCASWNVPAAPPAFRERVRSSIPALLLAGTSDAVTSVGWANDAAAGLRRARVLVFPGLGHGVADASACARAVMQDFLARLERSDAGCVDSVKLPRFDVSLSPSR